MVLVVQWKKDEGGRIRKNNDFILLLVTTVASLVRDSLRTLEKVWESSRKSEKVREGWRRPLKGRGGINCRLDLVLAIFSLPKLQRIGTFSHFL